MVRRQIGMAVAAMAAAGMLYLLTLLPHEASAPAVAVEQVTCPVVMEAMQRVMIQLAACDTEADARISAARTVRRGSAGYIHRDGQYRVLGAMAQTREEAEHICERLRQAGVQADCYPVEAKALTMKVTAGRAQIAALTAALHAMDMASTQPEAIARQLDAGEIDADRARGLVAMLVSDMEAAQADFADAGAQGLLSERLDAALSEAIAALEPLTRDDGQTTDLVLSGRIRCAGMKIWFSRAEVAGISV